MIRVAGDFYNMALHRNNSPIPQAIPSSSCEKPISEGTRFGQNEVNAKSAPPLALRSTMIRLARTLQLYPDNKHLADATAKNGYWTPVKAFFIAGYTAITTMLQGQNPLKSFLRSYIEARYTLGESPKDFMPTEPIVLPELSLKTDNLRYQELFDAMHQSWPDLVRQTRRDPSNSLIPLPHPYVVAGGRFNEMYYWDSYFIMLGLMVSGLPKLARGMVDNMLHMSEKYGLVPNGNRVYYLTRSQPPFLTGMIRKVADQIPDPKWLQHAYSIAKKEYFSVWMNPKNHQVKEFGLSRYHDPAAGKRIECVSRFYDGKPDTEDYYRHNRAECESGWDFTKRFDSRCNDFLPIDLNSLLYKYETDMAAMAKSLHMEEDMRYWEHQARDRKIQINRLMWDESTGMFFDYDTKTKKHTQYASLASFYPLWAGLADERQAQKLIENLKPFIAPGGLKTSLYETGEQWDGSNGWPCLQWMTIKGIQPYDPALAKDLAKRWLDMNCHVYQQDKMVYEKYNVSERSNQTFGHYPSQGPFFGWGMGVNMALLTDILGYSIEEIPQIKVA